MVQRGRDGIKGRRSDGSPCFVFPGWLSPTRTKQHTRRSLSLITHSSLQLLDPANVPSARPVPLPYETSLPSHLLTLALSASLQLILPHSSSISPSIAAPCDPYTRPIAVCCDLRRLTKRVSSRAASQLPQSDGLGDGIIAAEPAAETSHHLSSGFSAAAIWPFRLGCLARSTRLPFRLPERVASSRHLAYQFANRPYCTCRDPS